MTSHFNNDGARARAPSQESATPCPSSGDATTERNRVTVDAHRCRVRAGGRGREQLHDGGAGRVLARFSDESAWTIVAISSVFLIGAAVLNSLTLFFASLVIVGASMVILIAPAARPVIADERDLWSARWNSDYPPANTRAASGAETSDAATASGSPSSKRKGRGAC